MMFMESPATLQLMGALLEVGTAGATREHLVSKASIGTTTFYRVMKPLLERSLVTQRDNRYYLPLGNWYNYRFKLWYDSEKLYQMDDKDRQDILDILRQAQHGLRDSLVCLWLVGSAAHNTMHSGSDFDFLAVVRSTTLYSPDSARPVNFVTLTTEQFQDRYDKRDGFVLTALQYGILLLDRDFSQTYYGMSRPLEPADPQDSRQVMEQRRNRLFAYLETDDLELAARALETMAVTLSRLILQTLGELPAGKPELLELSRIMLGPRFHRWLQQALSKRNSKDRIIRLVRQWSDYRDRFFQNLTHLKAFSRLPYSRSLEFEDLCSGILHELFSAAASDRLDDSPGKGVDMLVRLQNHTTCAVLLKSTERHLDSTALEDLLQNTQACFQSGSDEMVHVVMIANPFRSLPVTERPALPVSSLGKSAAVHLLSAVDLLRVHNDLHLEDTTPQQALKQLLSA